MASPPKENAIGALRLLLASLVVISHAPELLDGNLGREPFHAIFGTLTFGAVAVDGFFLISGALIAASWVSNPSGYFLKRIRRIYPAFLVASLLCILVVAPLAGGVLPTSAGGWARTVVSVLMLKAPGIEGAFANLPTPAINGSMWSISYEFRCYILAALFGMIGLYRRPRVFAALTAAVLASNLIFLVPSIAKADAASGGWLVALFGRPGWTVRMTSLFMVGTCFYLLRPNYSGKIAGLLALPLLGLLFVPAMAEIALAVLGGYILFWTAYRLDWAWLRRLNARDDISYGLYLYAFPITQLIIFYRPHVNLLVLDAAVLGLSVIAGWLSWKLVEQPTLANRSKSRRLSPRTA